MKVFKLISVLTIIVTFFSCENEDSRTPLGITVSASDFNTEIFDNPTNGTILGTLTAFASDDSQITFEIVSETPEGALAIDNLTGEVSILDASFFNFEENPEINATVNASSGGVINDINISIFLNPNQSVLFDFVESNANPIFNWDLNTDISTWTGVTFVNNNITNINLSNSGITTVPESISNLIEITNIDLSNNNIITLPETISELTNLTSLDISDNQIIELSSTICDTFNFDEEAFSKDATTICLVIDETLINE